MKENSLEKQTGKSHISFTQINLYYHCPRLYWMNYIDPKRKKYSSKQQIFGSMQHDILCEINKLIKEQEDKLQLSMADIEKIFSERVKKYRLTLYDYNIAWKNIEHITLETIESRSQIYLAEEEFKIELVYKGKSIMLVCIIDRVDKTEDSIKITDYKSSPLVYTAEKVLHDLQLNIYALIIKKIFPNMPIFIERYSIGAGIGVKVQVDDAIQAKTESFIIDLWQQMEAETEWNPSDVNDYCQYCPKVCDVYKQKMFERYESKGVRDAESALSRFESVRMNRLLLEKEEDSIYNYLKMKFDINQGQPLKLDSKLVTFEIRIKDTQKVIENKICPDCKAIVKNSNLYQQLVIKDNFEIKDKVKDVIKKARKKK